jgi:hypothetical protein
MIIYHDTKSNVGRYCRRNSRSNQYRPKCCPYCNFKKVYGHGWRKRYVITGKRESQIEVHRFRCQLCRRTMTTLPTFLLKGFIRTTGSIINILQATLRNNQKLPYRQLASFYKNRFLSQVNKVLLYLRDKNPNETIPCLDIKRAIKALEFVQQTYKEGLSTSLFLFSNQHFMAN